MLENYFCEVLIILLENTRIEECSVLDNLVSKLGNTLSATVNCLLEFEHECLLCDSSIFKGLLYRPQLQHTIMGKVM